MVGKELALAFVTFVCINGCAHHQSKLACHKEFQQVEASVSVGGQVQRPGTVRIAQGGLTLRHAILAAGGHREMAVTTTFDNQLIDELNSDLETLVASHAIQGTIQAQLEAISELEPETVNILVTREALFPSKEDLVGRLSEQRSIATDIRKSLALSEDQMKTVDQLRTKVADIAFLEELLRLLGNDFFRSSIENSAMSSVWTIVDVKAKLKKEAQLESKVRRALVKLSTTAPSASYRSQGTNFVMLERNSSGSLQTYHFPYELVIANIAGDIKLRNGDIISVLEFKETSLATGIPTGTDVTVTGYVDKPGAMVTATTVGSLAKRINQNGEIKPTISDERSVWMLVRPGPTGGQEVYVLPKQMARSGDPSIAQTQDGDVFSYTILPQVPIVLSSLLATNRQQTERIRETRLQKFREKHREKKSARLQRIHTVLERACDRVIAPFRQ